MHAQVNTAQVAADSAAQTALTAGYGQSEAQAFEAAMWATALQSTAVQPAAPAVYAYRDAAGHIVGHVAVALAA